MGKINGFDFSSMDEVNVGELPQGTGFVILRCIRENGQEDISFQERYHALRDKRPEIVRMPYLFFNWYADGAAQADSLLNVGINFQHPGNGPVWIDLEADSGSAIEKYIVANRSACIQRVNACIAAFMDDARYGRQDIGIYSNDSFLRDTIAHTWPDCLFWLASYQSELPANPAQPVTIWQKAEFGRLDGTSGNDSSYGSFDLDVFVDNTHNLSQLANIKSS